MPSAVTGLLIMLPSSTSTALFREPISLMGRVGNRWEMDDFAANSLTEKEEQLTPFRPVDRLAGHLKNQ